MFLRDIFLLWMVVVVLVTEKKTCIRLFAANYIIVIVLNPHCVYNFEKY